MNAKRSALAAAVMWLVGGVAQARPPAPTKAPDNRPVIGVLDLRIEGVSDDVKAGFQRDLATRLDGKHYRLASWSEMQQQLAKSTRWTDGCLIGPCLADARTQTGAELVLLIALTGADTTFSHAITLVRTDTGRVVGQDIDHCDVCTVNEATARATQATIALLDRAPDRLDEHVADEVSAGVPATQARAALAAHELRTRRIGIALTVVGLVAVATGALLLATQDDQPTYAALTTIGGGGLALGGATILAF
ncbi:MAG TPA: hypothetical protein VGC42_26830 [Kofleriaceae bacterium]